MRVAVAAVSVVLVDRGTLQDAYDTVAATVVPVDGRSWQRDANGQVHIVRETLYIVDVIVAGESACPASVQFYDGVPVSFHYTTS